MEQMLTMLGEEGNNQLYSPLIPFSKSTGGKGKKGNNAYKHIPHSPRRIVGAF